MRDFQRGWYISLLIECWLGHGTIPNNPEILWRLAAADSREAFEAHSELVLSEFIEAEVDDKLVLVHPLMTNVYIEQLGKYEQKVLAAQKSVEKRRKEKANSLNPTTPSKEAEEVTIH